MATINSTQELLQRLKSILLKQKLVVFSAGILLTIAVLVLAGIGLSLLANIIWHSSAKFFLSKRQANFSCYDNFGKSHFYSPWTSATLYMLSGKKSSLYMRFVK